LDDDDLDWLLDDDGSVGGEQQNDHIVDPDLLFENPSLIPPATVTSRRTMVDTVIGY
jgi:hypothetical protein